MHDGMVRERRVLHYTSVSSDGCFEHYCASMGVCVCLYAGQIKPKNREEKHQPKYTIKREKQKPSRERRLLPMKHTTNEML